MTTLEPRVYAATLEDLKRRVRDARYTAQRRVNTELLRLYQSIGQTLLQRTESEAWGSRVIAQLAKDLRAEFSEKPFIIAGITCTDQVTLELVTSRRRVPRVVRLMAADTPPAPIELQRALHTIDTHVDTYIDRARLGKAA